MNTDPTLPKDPGHRRTGWLSAASGKIGAWIRRMLGRAGAGNNVQDFLQSAPGEDPPREIDEDFSSEMFGQLLLELPAHRSEIAESWRAGDLPRLRSCVHRLLGAAVYCDAPQLEEALRELRRALHTNDIAGIAQQHARTLAVIDTTLGGSSYLRGR